MTRQINTQDKVHQLAGSPWNVFSAWLLVLTPVLLVAADLLRMSGEADGRATGSVDVNAGADSLVANFAAIASNTLPYGVATVITYILAFVAVPAVLLGWSMTAKATPVLAKGAVVVGLLFVFGRVTHTFTAFALPMILVEQLPTAQAAQLYAALNLHWAAALVIIPTVIGIALWFPLLAVALYRAHVIPLWAMVSMLLGSVVLLLLGSSFVATPIFGVLTVAGLLPAVRAAVRRSAVR